MLQIFDSMFVEQKKNKNKQIKNNDQWLCRKSNVTLTGFTSAAGKSHEAITRVVVNTIHTLTVSTACYTNAIIDIYGSKMGKNIMM